MLVCIFWCSSRWVLRIGSLDLVASWFYCGQDFYNLLQHDTTTVASSHARGLARMAARRLKITQTADLVQVMNGPVRKKLGIIPSNVRYNAKITLWLWFLEWSILEYTFFMTYETSLDVNRILRGVAWTNYGVGCNSWAESSGLVFVALSEDFMKDTIEKVAVNISLGLCLSDLRWRVCQNGHLRIPEKEEVEKKAQSLPNRDCSSTDMNGDQMIVNVALVHTHETLSCYAWCKVVIGYSWWHWHDHEV